MVTGKTNTYHPAFLQLSLLCAFHMNVLSIIEIHPFWNNGNVYNVTMFILFEGYVSIDELRTYSGELQDFLPGHCGSSVSKKRRSTVDIA